MESKLALVGSWVMLMSICTYALAADNTHGANTPATATPCEDASDQRTLTACWSKASRVAEELVDAALKKATELLASRTGPSTQRLQDDQRRWRAYVEGHCGLYGELFDGGSAAAMSVSVCRWQLAQVRIQQLADLTYEVNR
jgi:uncharacterized protein YecT (DUF1311 family)